MPDRRQAQPGASHMKWIFCAVAVLGLSSAALAEKIDLSTMTCQKFQASSKEEISIILTWLDAYYKDEDAPAVIDTEKFVENAKKLGQYCAANPSIGLI